jgi:PAS domain S-box-containing protein
MMEKLQIAVCRHFHDEFARILSTLCPQATVFTYPCKCVTQPAVPLATTDTPETLYFGSSFCLPDSTANLPDHRVYRMDVCFELLTGRDIIRHYIEEGAYLVTPGWLNHWREHLQGLGFEQSGAIEFFRESTNKLVLLDSGVDPQAREKLQDFAAWVQLPWNTFPAGLDVLHRIVEAQLLKFRHLQAKLHHAQAQQQVADYAMALDVMSSLVRDTDEGRIIQSIFDVFTMLFAPGQMSYLPLKNGRAGAILTRAKQLENEDDFVKNALSLREDYLWNPDGAGFMLRIGNSRTTWGVLKIDGMTFSQHKEHYLNLALHLSGVCGLAISNARQYSHVCQAEAAAAGEKEKLLVTLNSIGDGVITTDAQGYIQLMNDVALSLTGRTQAETEGQPLTDVYRTLWESTGNIRENPVNQVLDSGRTVHPTNDTLLVSGDGSKRHINDRADPICDKEGKIIGVVLVFRDITKEKKIQGEMLKTNKLKSIAALAGGIAHDFNNLLTVILGNASLAKSTVTPEDKIYDRIREIEKGAAGAQKLTQRLLTLSKGGAPVKKVLPLGPLIKEWADFILSGSNVKSQLEISEDLLLVEVDPGQLSQVFNNLLLNAQQAMPDGGHVHIKAENVRLPDDREEVPLEPGLYVKITVTDRGGGIPQPILDHIFDPFYTTKKEGSGLGLFICFSIIKSHDGHIMVRSKAGEGSTFTIYLPVIFRSAVLAPEETQQLHMGHGKILVMDDDPMVRDFAGEMLCYLGYDVAFATDGEEAICTYREAQASGQPFDLVIMDLTVPGGMGGKEALNVLKSIDPAVRAIVSSGYSHNPIIASYADYGFKQAVAKPYRVEEMSQVLHEVLQNP